MLGAAVVTALAYSVLASLVLPVAEAFIGQIARIVYYQFLSPFIPDNDSYKRPKDKVFSWELQKHADNTQSSYALARYKEWETSARKSNEDTFELGRMAFRALVLLLVNIYLSSPGHPSTIFTLANLISSDAFTASLICAALVLFGLVCRSWCRPRFSTNWVTYAPLYNQIEEKRRAELERMRELSENR